MDTIKNVHSHCVLNPGCASRKVFEVISGRWEPPVIMALKDETKRHGELEGISQKMLIQTLRNLEHNGLVEREVYNCVIESGILGLLSFVRTNLIRTL